MSACTYFSHRPTPTGTGQNPSRRTRRWSQQQPAPDHATGHTPRFHNRACGFNRPAPAGPHHPRQAHRQQRTPPQQRTPAPARRPAPDTTTRYCTPPPAPRENPGTCTPSTTRHSPALPATPRPAPRPACGTGRPRTTAKQHTPGRRRHRPTPRPVPAITE
ncbi:hypothetical protein SAM23877_7456 [Streptomyces ambofaciens ATCC 23877]|uniref:Uncharacterized protein n=1 Tax=Streptomyces ambofaciens (strain ATCC 23877 / 3486 / DSM 40053 / JCM 4204 / NBRC 12836 / NRRL B-2516) TaxID=278992 RepID=A0A0K2B619_STRA7|nr:hypothetical protein SAM23877_0217 [Streptomyces ambofaciens ATCC 23877]AKZ60497.1 hypothetical protein SAM23877_7456 [Streptomyces ambofaciens ATCC 23877]